MIDLVRKFATWYCERMVAKNPPVAEETITIDCGDGVYHRISLIRGSLVLHDHPDIIAEKALIALGGEQCECLRILHAWRKAWRRGYVHMLPREFKKLYARISQEPRIQERRRRKNESSKDELDRRLRSRAKDRVEEIVRAEILRCKYRRGVQHTVKVEVFDATDDRGSFIRGNAWEGKALNTKRRRYEEWITVYNSFIDVRVLLRWYSRVYKRGIAVVDGCFVVDAIEDPRLGTVVLAGRQDPDGGYKIRPAAARVVDGKLEWL